jgi:predicted nuclease with TOPRIM domain
MKPTDSARIRAALQKAADDLLEGRVPGPLTGMRLVELANVKRHRLTHDNPDINRSFQQRAREINRSKPEVESLRDQLAHERERTKRLSQERDSLAEELRNYATVLMMVTNERDQLLEQLQTNGNLMPINRPPSTVRSQGPD